MNIPIVVIQGGVQALHRYPNLPRLKCRVDCILVVRIRQAVLRMKTLDKDMEK